MTMRWLIPVLFVGLWSTGFTVSKLGLPYAEPLTFLSLRFAIAASVLLLLMLFIRRQWPRSLSVILHACAVGLMIQALYLGGVFSAIGHGVDAGLSALIVSLQPLLTVALVRLFYRESPSRTQLAGVVLGLLGVALVVSDRGIDSGGLDITGGLMLLTGLVGISVGTVYQKHFGGQIDLLVGVFFQYLASSLFLLPFAWLTESMVIDWQPTFVFSLSWLVVALSLGAVFLLLRLIKSGHVTQVASLIYLVPPVVSVQAWFLFEETLSWLAITGVVLCVAGVAVVARSLK